MKKVKDLKKGDTCFVIDSVGKTIKVKVKIVTKNFEDYRIEYDRYDGIGITIVGFGNGEQTSTSFGSSLGLKTPARAYVSKEEALKELYKKSEIILQSIKNITEYEKS